jgi:hypothetical protein
MSIHYRSLLRGEPGVPGGGVKKYYATIVLGEEVTIDEIVKEDVNETLIYDQSIRYLPGQKLRQALANANYKKVDVVYK